MSNFGRVLTAMVTPFAASGGVDYAETERLAVYLARHGSDGIVVCGTTGESPTLTWEEEHELFRVVKQAVGEKTPVIAGTGSNSTTEAISATEKAMKLGLDGSLQVVPYYNKPPAEGLYQHFAAIARACPEIDILLYNIPGRTGKDLPAETVARLAEIPNIIGVKEASGQLDRVSHLRQLVPPEFAIYSGDDSLTLPMVSVGANGVVSVASHLVGDRMQEMLEAFQTGNTAKATEIHLQLFPLFKSLFVATNPIPIKAALHLQGWGTEKLRLPLVQASESVRDELKTVLANLGLVE